MANTYFKFKQFTINQQFAAMKVGTDSVLLGAYTKAGECNKILDIGCGTAILSLMMAQKSEALIDAIEIDSSSYVQATENVRNSLWSDRINVINDSIQHYTQNCKKYCYDLIICNPPYFEQSYKAKDIARSNARHTDMLSYQELLDSVSQLLSAKGLFSVVLPFVNKNNFITIAASLGLHLSEILTIFPNSNLPAKRNILQFKKVSNTHIKETNLTIEKNIRHHYTDEYIELTKDFYLRF